MRPLFHRFRCHNTVVFHGHRKLALYAGILFALVALLPRQAAAAVHPVPLDKNVDAAKCAECHEDKTKGKFVHSAIATGCLSCHEVRVTKDATHIKLITATPVALCITCHADKKAADIKGTVHPPAVRDCLACHDPHSSDNKNQLLKPESGGKKRIFASIATRPGSTFPTRGAGTPRSIWAATPVTSPTRPEKNRQPKTVSI